MQSYSDTHWTAWPHDSTVSQNFTDIDSHHPSIHVKSTIDPQQVHFLDTKVNSYPFSTTHGRISTQVYFKATDTSPPSHKQLPPHIHTHTQTHTFKGIIKSNYNSQTFKQLHRPSTVPVVI